MMKFKKGIVALSAVLLTVSAGVAFSAPTAHAVPSHSFHSTDGGEGDWPVPHPG